MASNFRPRIIFSALILTLCLSPAVPASAASAFSNEGQQQAPAKEHIFRFYLDPALVPDIHFARMVLPKYVADMNYILQKNTNRRMVFNPEVDIVLTNTQPHSNQATSPLPVEDFEIWAYAIYSGSPDSQGGYAGIDQSGAGVIAGLSWNQLYDPDRLAPGDVANYWTQINNMLHELAHIFGAGSGEYYKLSFIQDTSGVSPFLHINILDQEDSFWSDKSDFKSDPLLINATQIAGINIQRKTLLELARYANLTAAIMSGNYRNSIPTVDLSKLTIKIIDAKGKPVASANVKVWSVVGNSPYPSQLMVDGSTNPDGSLTFPWGGSANPHNNHDFLRLIKVYKDGYVAFAKYVSIYDVDISRLLEEKDTFTLTLQLNVMTPDAQALFEDVTTEYFARPSIEKLYSTRITGGCSALPFMYCPEQVVTRSQMAIFLERGMNSSTYAPPAATRQIFADVPASYWAASWIEQLAADGITGGCGGGNYCPEAPVTRAQMAIFLLRAKYGVAYVPPLASGVFADVPLNHWAAAWIEQLAAEGVTSGCGEGIYCPETPVNRAQMAVFLVRTFNLP